MNGHAAFDAAADGARLVLGEIVAVPGAEQDEDLLHRALDRGRRVRAGRGPRIEGMRDVGHEPGGHLGRGQFIVDEASGDGATRHPVEFAGGEGLGHDHAALALDGAHALATVAAGAREHDADGPLALVQGERPEQEVDRQALAARCHGFQQLQRAVQERHVAVGRDDVGAVGPQHDSVLDLEHLHAGVPADKFRKEALVVRGQVLHEHEGHPRIGFRGHAGEEGLERRQSAGRRANADDGEPGTDRRRRLEMPR